MSEHKKANKVFFTSDSHFLHDNIKKYCSRPDNYNRLLIDNWNSVISKDDFVFHLGDVSAGVNKHENGYEKLKKIMNALNGEKHLIRGNHDHYTNEQYVNDFGFSSVNDYIVYKDYFLCHYPLIVDKYTSEKHVKVFADLKDKFKESNAKYLVHGHSHMTKYGGKRINVSVDLTGFTPVEEDSIKLL